MTKSHNFDDLRRFLGDMAQLDGEFKHLVESTPPWRLRFTLHDRSLPAGTKTVKSTRHIPAWWVVIGQDALQRTVEDPTALVIWTAKC